MADMLDPFLSLRGGTSLASRDRPWYSAPIATYDPDLNPDGLISFGTAENVLVTNELGQFVQKNVRLSARDLLYASVYEGGPDFPPVLAAHLNDILKPHAPISPHQIRLTASATAAHDILAWALADPQDAILLSRPIYGRLELDFFNKSLVNVEYANTTAENCLNEDVVDEFEKAKRDAESRGIAVKAVFITNPHNPLGRCYPRQTLVNILAFCQRHNLHLICDEIYATSVFDSGEPNCVPFTSVLSINTAEHIDSRLLHVSYGLSKGFCAAGLNLGCVITQSEPLLGAIDTVSRFSGPSGPSLSVAKAMLGDREWCRAFLEQTRVKLAAAYKHVTAELNEAGIRFLPGTNAGFFLWIDLSPFLPEARVPEFALAEKLENAGVFLHPKEEHSLQAGWFRLVYTHDPRTVSEGVRRIKSVILQHQ